MRRKHKLYLNQFFVVIFIPLLLAQLVLALFMSPNTILALTASELDKKAETTCKAKTYTGPKSGLPRSLDDCKAGYKIGYNGNSLEGCEKYSGISLPGSSTNIKYDNCNAGYGFGQEDAKKEEPAQDPESPQQQDAATKFCNKSSYSDAEKDSCRRGYKERLKGSDVDVCGSTSGALFRACETGWKEADRIKQETSAAKEAEQACSEKYSGNNDKIESCISGYTGRTGGKSQTKACEGVKDKAACREGFALATGDKPEDSATNPDCTSGGHPLGWILCPIIDAGAGFTDWVFTTFIQGILEDVPITTEASDGGYLAWQNFRLLGNLLLVITLMAIVYAQVRGGGGR